MNQGDDREESVIKLQKCWENITFGTFTSFSKKTNGIINWKDSIDSSGCDKLNTVLRNEEREYDT